jgi:hypothetical protein
MNATGRQCGDCTLCCKVMAIEQLAKPANAWRKQPFRSELQQWAVSGETLDMTVVVIVGQRVTLVTPEHEFDLGIVGPDQRIVREMEGTRVINATVARASDLEQ